MLVIVIFGAQLVAIQALDPEAFPQSLARRIIFLSPVLLVPVLLLRFHALLGAWIIAAGIIMNLLPMAAHGGLMPVAFERVATIGGEQHVIAADVGRALPGSKNVLLWKRDIHFDPLSDRFQSQRFGLRPAQFSAGDATELLGIAVAAMQMIFCSLHASPPRERDTERATDRRSLIRFLKSPAEDR